MKVARLVEQDAGLLEALKQQVGSCVGGGVSGGMWGGGGTHLT